MKAYYREQKHICGPTYMEVDLYPVTQTQHKASPRAKRREASSLAQQQYNDKRAKRYCIQLAHANFVHGDFVVTLTYSDENQPAPGDTRRVDRDLTNFIKRLYRFCNARGLPHPKWMGATEYATVDELGTVVGRNHHHMMIQRVPGLTREIVEELWGLGLVRAEKLDTVHGSIEALVRYINKNRRCSRRWRQSRGLTKPLTPRPNDTKWTRTKLERASTLYIDDADYWAAQYPDYRLDRVETDVSPDGRRHTLVILHRPAEHERGGTRTPWNKKTTP